MEEEELKAMNKKHCRWENYPNIVGTKANNEIWNKNFQTSHMLTDIKGNAQFVQKTTFGPWGKNDSSTPKNIL